MSSTIKDVARLAGCSIKTVSRVINDEPYVTEETRRRVRAAIRTIGYAPNISARRLVSQRSFMICILMYPGYYQPASGMLSRILDIGYLENYDIMIQTYYPTLPRSKNKLVDAINERRYDGFITTPPCDAEDFVADLLRTYKVPLVQINPFNRSAGLPYVAGDDKQGAQTITQHLIKLGHRHIAFFKGPRNMRSSFDRFYGYQAALEAHHIRFDPNLTMDTEATFDGGYTAARILLERQNRPGAIYAASDEAAYGAIFAAQEMRLRIPADLSICGHDDLVSSKNIWPGLTTIHQPAGDMIETAVQILFGMLKGQPPANTQVILPARLVIRASTAEPPA